MLRSVKSKVFVDYIYSNSKDIVITTNKVIALSNLNIVEKNMKDLKNELKTTIIKILSQNFRYSVLCKKH